MNPTKIAMRRPPNGNIIFDVNPSSKSKNDMPNIVNPSNKLNEKREPKPISQVIIPRRMVASALLYEYLSIKKLMAGSINEIDEVIAAKKSNMKNNVAMTSPNGIAPKAIGSVLKISPGPAVEGSRLYVKTIGNIIIPARIATNVSEKATTVVTSEIEESLDKYEP
tara:strand:- start:60 stop:557 length:498 start_codon:yes stop_codon:yes gene_type:complete